MEHKLIVLAMVLGVVLGVGIPAFLSTVFHPVLMPISTEQRGVLKGEEGLPPKVVKAPESAYNIAGGSATKIGPKLDRYLMALTLPIFISLITFLAFSFFIKKG